MTPEPLALSAENMPEAPRLPPALPSVDAAADLVHRHPIVELRSRVAELHRDHLVRHSWSHRTFLANMGSACSAVIRAHAGGSAGFAEPGGTSGAVRGGAELGYPDLLTLVRGRVSDVFGARFAELDGKRHIRLPGPPFLFISRVVAFGEPAGDAPHGSAVVEYDVPKDVWYVEQNGAQTTPMAVIVEIALQACGVLSMHAGSPLQADAELFFRNLDGTAAVLREVRPGSTVRTSVIMTSDARFGGVGLQTFTFASEVEGVRTLTGTASFGYFPEAELERQTGLPTTDEDRAVLALESDHSVDLTELPPTRRPGPMLLMLDRVTGYWPGGGSAGLGKLRAEKDVSADAWYFEAHFFQDPVQPGSLGVEAMCQLLQHYLVTSGRAAAGARFEPVRLGHEVSWTYRGQILPIARTVVVEVDIVEVGADDGGAYAVAEAWLWLDDRRIYHVRDLGMRVVPDVIREHAEVEELLDPAMNPWIADHCPTWTVPALAMMSTVDRMAKAAADLTGQPVLSMRDVRLRRWLPITGPVRLRTRATARNDGIEVELSCWRDAKTAALSRFEPVATSTVHVGAGARPAPRPFAPLIGAAPEPNPYESAALFHGPSYRYLTSLAIGPSGASATLDAAAGQVPRGYLHQGLLDAATHAIPHSRLSRWDPEVAADGIAFPHRITYLDRYGELPDAGTLQVEVRYAGLHEGDPMLPSFDIQVIEDGRVLLAVGLVDIVIPTGLPDIPLPRLRMFLRDKIYADGLGLSRTQNGETVLRHRDVDWIRALPGAAEQVYAIEPGLNREETMASIAVKDHVGRLTENHPANVEVDRTLLAAWPATDPDHRHTVEITHHTDETTVRTAVG